MRPGFMLSLLGLIIMSSCKNGANNVVTNNFQLSEIEVGVEIPKNEVPLSSLSFERQGGFYKLDSVLYSGYAMAYYPDGNLKTKIGFVNGMKQGEACEYFGDGHLKSLAYYHENKLHGEKKNWAGTDDHYLMACRNYHLGLAHGEHVKWYGSGQVFKIMNYKMGKEVGLQQAFLENGKLYANYEAKNGRSFGLKKAMLCFEVDEGSVSVEGEY